MTSDKSEFDDCGCPSHINQDGVRTVNPNCEHLRAWLDPVADGFRCSNCGKMFLPAINATAIVAALLQEVDRQRGELEKIRAAAREYKFGREYFQTGRGVHVGTEAIEKMAEEALGK